MIVQVDNADRTTPSDIRDIFVRARDGSMIPLANLISVDETVSPRELNHFGQRRAVKMCIRDSGDADRAGLLYALAGTRVPEDRRAGGDGRYHLPWRFLSLIHI